MGVFQKMNLAQGSDPWLVWRSEGITATDSAIIMGVSKRITPWRLYAEKKGWLKPDDLSNNPFVRHGKEYEPIARSAVEELEPFKGEMLFPTCVQSNRHPWLRASLDGLLSNNEPVELKCPSASVIFEAYRNGKNSVFYRRYWHQVQHQLAVTGASKGYLLALLYDPTDEATTEPFIVDFVIERDDAHIAKLIKMGGDWYKQHLLANVEPAKSPTDPWIPKTADTLTWESEGKQLAELLDQEAKIKASLKPIKKEKEIIIDRLAASLRQAGSLEGETQRVVIKISNRRGSVDYKKILNAAGIKLSAKDLDAARGPSTSSVSARLKSESDINAQTVKSCDPETAENVVNIRDTLDHSLSFDF